MALSEKALFLLTLIARHDGTTPQAVLTRMVAERAEAIGLSPLLGRHFDELTDLPACERAGQNRYASGGP
ncbi:MAG: hypothetical protein BGN87_00280 [Rhizobiales bacterium 65-79]|nr:hypothetical protein [Hyphomicrobiales bacterium]OJU02621.1 MAG: hypothetical protein BGN87_00280 [Rhizobiales bacterium 65-79]